MNGNRWYESPPHKENLHLIIKHYNVALTYLITYQVADFFDICIKHYGHSDFACTDCETKG